MTTAGVAGGEATAAARRALTPSRPARAGELSEPYSTSDVCELVDGLTYRMLDYWDRTRAVIPSIAARGSGTRRAWSDRDVDALRVIVAELTAAHAVIEAVRSGRRFRELVTQEPS